MDVIMHASGGVQLRILVSYDTADVKSEEDRASLRQSRVRVPQYAK